MKINYESFSLLHFTNGETELQRLSDLPMGMELMKEPGLEFEFLDSIKAFHSSSLMSGPFSFWRPWILWISLLIQNPWEQISVTMLSAAFLLACSSKSLQSGKREIPRNRTFYLNNEGFFLKANDYLLLFTPRIHRALNQALKGDIKKHIKWLLPLVYRFILLSIHLLKNDLSI